MAHSSLLIMVQYSLSLKESSLPDLCRYLPDTKKMVRLHRSELVDQSEYSLFGDVIFDRRDDNPGLGDAYLAALNYCMDHKINYLILADEDTTFTPLWAQEISSFLDSESPGAYIPRVYTRGGVLLSPCLWFGRGRVIRGELTQSSMSRGDISFINSGAVLPVWALRDGWLEGLPFLDGIDHYTSILLKKLSCPIYLGEAAIDQSYSGEEGDIYAVDRRYTIWLKDMRWLYSHLAIQYKISIFVAIALKTLSYCLKFRSTRFIKSLLRAL